MLKYLILLTFAAGIRAATLDQFIHTLGQIESGNNDLAIGDKGKSISRYQIQYSCYLDAKEYNKQINFSYSSLTNSNNARVIVLSYFKRYAAAELKNNDFESLARLWNSGPNWKNKLDKTNKYWGKIRAKLP